MTGLSRFRPKGLPGNGLPIRLLAAAAVISACESAKQDDAGVLDGGVDARDAEQSDADLPDVSGPDAGPWFMTTLTSSGALAGLAGPTGDVKYLSPVAGVTPRPPITEPCYFQNMNVFDYHLRFLRSFTELSTLTATDYRDLVLRRPTRIWWGGGVKHYPATPHPSAGQGVTVWTVYHEVAGADRLSSDDLVAVHSILSECVGFSPDRLAFLPTDPFQTTFARQERAALLGRGIAVIFAEELR
ncbi:MAG: hypothetical protein HY791_16880 [Deltaproteobacteria bacterium]|nr:hypothetical protein [Deltaproteobacteria bacterium]